MAKKYEKIGDGTFGVYRKKPTDWGSIIGGIVLVVVALVVIANIAG